MIGRVKDEAAAVDSPIGSIAGLDDIGLQGVTLSKVARQRLFECDVAGWRDEIDSLGQYLQQFAPRLPTALETQRQAIAQALR